MMDLSRKIGTSILLLNLLIIASASQASTSYGREIAGLNFPEKLTINDTTLNLNGVGVRTKTIFKVKVYAAGLYLQSPTQDHIVAVESDQLKKLELIFLRNIGKDQLIEAFEEGFKNNCEPHCDKLKPQFNELASLISDTKEGDKIEFIFYPGRLYVRQETKSNDTSSTKSRDISSRDFSKTILKFFIGDEHPADDALKAGLLGITKN